MIIEFTIPGLPRRTNNNVGNWRSRWSEARKWKRLVCDHVILGNLAPARPLEKAQLTLTRHSGNQPDFDGLVSSFKHVIDGLISAGVLAGDKPSNIGRPEYLWAKAPPKNGFITIRVEEI